MIRILWLLLFFGCTTATLAQEDRETSEFWNKSGLFFMDAGAHKFANYFFQEGFKRDSTDKQLRLIARNFLKWGKLEDACVQFEKLIARESIQVEDLYVLSKLLYMSENYSKSKEMFQQHLDLGGEMNDEKRIWSIHLNHISPLIPPTTSAEAKTNRYCIQMYSASPMNNNPTGVKSVWVTEEGDEYSGESIKICFRDAGIHKLSLHQFDDLTQEVYQDVEVMELHFLEKNYFDVTPGKGERQMDFDLTPYIPEELGRVYVLWDFGDGQLGFGPEISHTYSKSRAVNAKVYVYSEIDGYPSFCAGIERNFAVRK